MSKRTVSRRCRSTVGAVSQLLESRRLLDASYWSLASGSLIQDWENRSLITVNDNWSGVPSIEGYFFSRTGSTNTDPQTILGDPPAGSTASLDVTANQTSGNVTTGGVIEVHLPAEISVSGTGTVAMQGSDAADDPFLKFYIDNSGRSEAVRIRYDLIDIDSTAASTANPTRQSFALQYRIGESGDFTNVPEGYVENAADFTSGATGLTTSLDVTLPADTIGAAQVQIRILTTNASGTDQLVAVDNIRVFGNDAAGGSIAFDPSSYSVIESVGTANLTLKRIGSTSGTVSVSYTINAGTASAGSDFIGGSGIIEFADGQAQATIPVTIVDDFAAEPAEQFTVTISNPTGGAALGTATTATVTINDDDIPVPAVLLNEIKVNPPDLDAGAEWVEIIGAPGTTLQGLYFVSIEGDGTGAGLADVVIPLGSFSIGSSGLLVIGSPDLVVPVGTTLVGDVVFDTTGGVLENGTNTFALIFSPIPIVVGTDLDPGNDFNLDLPAGANVIDAIAAFDGGGADVIYGPLLDLGGIAASAATRKLGNTNANDASAWYYGGLLDVAIGDASETGVYDPRPGLNFDLPQGAVLTLGATNYNGSVNAGEFVLIPIAQTVNEDIGSITVEIYRSNGAIGNASVRVSTLDDSATAGEDYEALNQVIEFADGEFSKTVSINITDDNLPELGEAFIVQLTDPTGGATIVREGFGFVNITLSDPVQPTGLLLNEWNNNPPGADGLSEYIELRGTPGELLINTYILIVEGSGATPTSTLPGTLDVVINLTGARIGSNGLLLIKPAAGGFEPIDPATGVFTTTVLDGAPIESDTNTILLAFAPPGAIVPSTGIDLDPTNSGTLNLDSQIVLLDGVSWLDGDADPFNIAYASAVLPALGVGDGLDAAVRFVENANAFDASAWYFGNLTGPNNSTEFDSLVVSTNFPTGGRLTPGAANTLFSDTIAPEVTASTFNFVVGPQSLSAQFSEDVGASLGLAGAFTLTNLTTSSTVTLNVVVGGTGDSATLTFVNTGNDLGSAVLADGNYRLTYNASVIEDVAGNNLTADVSYDFFFKNADISRDGTVGFSDLLALAQNYGLTGTNFSTGDVNYDGNTDFGDLLALAQRYNTGLVSTPARTTQRGARSRIFSEDLIG